MMKPDFSDMKQEDRNNTSIQDVVWHLFWEAYGLYVELEEGEARAVRIVESLASMASIFGGKLPGAAPASVASYLIAEFLVPVYWRRREDRIKILPLLKRIFRKGDDIGLRYRVALGWRLLDLDGRRNVSVDKLEVVWGIFHFAATTGYSPAIDAMYKLGVYCLDGSGGFSYHVKLGVNILENAVSDFKHADAEKLVHTLKVISLKQSKLPESLRLERHLTAPGSGLDALPTIIFFQSHINKHVFIFYKSILRALLAKGYRTGLVESYPKGIISQIGVEKEREKLAGHLSALQQRYRKADISLSGEFEIKSQVTDDYYQSYNNLSSCDQFSERVARSACMLPWHLKGLESMLGLMSLRRQGFNFFGLGDDSTLLGMEDESEVLVACARERIMVKTLQQFSKALACVGLYVGSNHLFRLHYLLEKLKNPARRYLFINLFSPIVSAVSISKEVIAQEQEKQHYIDDFNKSESSGCVSMCNIALPDSKLATMKTAVQQVLSRLELKSSKLNPTLKSQPQSQLSKRSDMFSNSSSTALNGIASSSLSVDKAHRLKKETDDSGAGVARYLLDFH